MTVAIDFDGTIKCSAEPTAEERHMWCDIIAAFKNAGHEVIIVTMRIGSFSPSRIEVEAELLQIGHPDLPVIYCGDVGTKREVCQQKGYRVGIWIDDMPEMIGYNSVPSWVSERV